MPGITAVPHEDNLRYFDVTIDGPAQSPYEGGVFKLELFLPEDYPSMFFFFVLESACEPSLTLCSGRPKSPFLDQDLSPQHRPPGPYLPGRFKRFVLFVLPL